ncbi:hypothetical protein [Variovorax sp. UMC13]|uniref:hypothetical protein n=1 Tax=Variovorax sp. UMC13 TaxID=1862326 RepID=UPI0016019F17|nr:hypothetical protein [Variovorax sp. UMC13]
MNQAIFAAQQYRHRPFFTFIRRKKYTPQFPKVTGSNLQNAASAFHRPNKQGARTLATFVIEVLPSALSEAVLAFQ